MYSRKTENAQLEDLLNEYFRTRSYFPYGSINHNHTSVHNPSMIQWYRYERQRNQFEVPDNRHVNRQNQFECSENRLVQHKYKKPDIPIFEFKSFFSMTSLHGFSHIVEKKNKIGKLIWIVCLVAVYILCGISISTLIRLFWETPAIISLDNHVSTVWTIPYPAVTICSSNPVRSSIYNYSNINRSNEEDQLNYDTLYSVCEKYPLGNVLNFSQNYLDGSLVSKVLKKLSFSCQNIVTVFWFQKYEKEACEKWLQTTFTSYGLCYSFNMMPIGDLLNGVDLWSEENNNNWKHYESSWYPDTGYSSGAITDNLPLRSFGDILAYGAIIKLNIHLEEFNKECSHGLQAFYLIFHSPAEWPDYSHPTMISGINTLETIYVKPIVITTTNDLKHLDSHERKCYFQHEKKLKFFKIYTQNNCILECRSSNILNRCGCVPFYNLRIKSTPVCGPGKMSCWMATSQESSHSCGCLPGCSELSYKITSTNFQLSDTSSKSNNSSSLSSSLMLYVMHYNKHFIGMSRIMISTLGEFIGNVGGIMGLCLGFSFLSLIEIIYFLTLRPFINFLNKKKQMRKISPAHISRNIPDFTYEIK